MAFHLVFVNEGHFLIDRIVTPLLKVSGVLRNKTTRYVAGSDSDSAIRRARHLHESGYLSCITFLKRARNQIDARANARVYQEVLDMLSAAGLPVSLTLSLSQFAFALDRFLARELIRQVIMHAVRHNVLVWIETSQEIRPDVNLDLAMNLHRVPGIQGHVGLTIEASLYRAGHDLPIVLDEGIPVRLRARGWATDKESSFRATSKIQHNFLRLTELLLDSGRNCTIATRDRTLIRQTTNLLAATHWSRNIFDFEIPDGVKVPEPLAPGAWNIRKLIPFGPEYESYLAQTFLGIDRGPQI